MNAEGYDHILFVMALVAVYRWTEIKQVAILVTAFTIGHTLTLLLATMEIVNISMTVIEFLIPLTIVITALYNMIARKKLLTKPSLYARYTAAFGFGLIHGLGFSNYLRALLSKSDQLLTPLLAFNIGLELGQLLCVIFFLIIYWILYKTVKLDHKIWIYTISILVLILAMPILIESFKTLTN